MATRAERKARRVNLQPKRRAVIVGLPASHNNFTWRVRCQSADYRTDPPSVREDRVEVVLLRGPGAPNEGTPIGAVGTVQWDDQALVLLWEEAT